MKIFRFFPVFIISINTIIAQDFNFTDSKISIDGYGEIHYNSEKIGNQSTKSVLDFHRFVIFFRL